MLQGEESWQQKGGTFTRTESLAEYSARVPRAIGTTCEAVATTTPGQVHETAILRSGYLVATRAQIVVQAQATQGEALVFIKIGNVPVRTLKP